MTTVLVAVDHAFVNFRNGTFQWVDVQRFHLTEATAGDSAVLAALIGHEVFGNDYAGGRPGGDGRRHGPYWRDRITPDCFAPTGAAIEEARLRAWAEQYAPLTEQLRADLDVRLYRPLHTADRVYRLLDLGAAAFHDWGGVHGEFHELVLVSRASRTLTLVVAADD